MSGSSAIQQQLQTFGFALMSGSHTDTAEQPSPCPRFTCLTLQMGVPHRQARPQPEARDRFSRPSLRAQPVAKRVLRLC